ncbi:ATP synthase F0 subunit A [Candidatus Falkowbacteria bacterium CG1_02_37_21]|nr:MAG: ATP synthase F0 subunit A [Candidatus Falkowbacteria bacterium CG1_02_37_21]
MIEEIIHENTLFAEPIMHLGHFTITNSLLTSALALIIIITLAWLVRRNLKEVPTGIQNVLEMIVDAFLGIFDSVTGSRKKSLQFAPLVLAFFFFILVNNWMGLLPGVGSIGQLVREHGELVFVPYLRGATADLNTTLALATLGVVLSHIFGVLAVGWWQYLNKFINLKAFLEIPGKIRKDPMIILINPIKAFVGLIEIVGELAKVASLAFRLFGNVFAGEVLLASISAILAFAVPVPFLFLEILVGLIQALIFAMLVLTYLTISTTAEEH